MEGGKTTYNWIGFDMIVLIPWNLRTNSDYSFIIPFLQIQLIINYTELSSLKPKYSQEIPQVTIEG